MLKLKYNILIMIKETKKSPELKASQFRLGVKKKGTDGNNWIVSLRNSISGYVKYWKKENKKVKKSEKSKKSKK